jgi:putative transposase
MPRQLRGDVPAGYYHVAARGNRNDSVFLDDIDRTWFLTLLTRVVTRESWQCLAYCLMSNHYHLVLHIGSDSLPRGMRWLNGLYAQSFNDRHDRRGHVFGGRYRLTYIESEQHLAEACRYVVCNPVRASLCDHPAAWAWSSYRATAGVEPAPSCLALSMIRGLFGGRDGYVTSVDEVLP